MLSKEATIKDYREWYEQSYQTIECECVRLGHSFGFNPPILNSVESLAAKPRLLVATLNPAGNVDYPAHRGLYRYEGLNAYLDIDWGGYDPGEEPLQRQMQLVFDHLRTRICGTTVDPQTFARSRVVTAQLISFRSPSEDSLHRPEESKQVSRDIWQKLFTHWVPSAAVAVGKDSTAKELGALFGEMTSESSLPTGWGSCRMDLKEFASGTRLLALPHLSRFKIFGRPAGEPYLNEAFDWLTEKARS